MKRDLNKFNQAQKLRQNGKSIRFIANKLKISSSTSSIWCKNIVLTHKQQQKLNSKSQNIELLRSFALKRHNDKLSKHQIVYSSSRNEIEKLTEFELFKTGLALYWAEGFKNPSEQRVGFCNSDPRMIKFIMSWFQKSLKISEDNITLRVEFNKTHSSRKDEIEKFWSDLTGIPISQFNKPYFQTSNSTKDYSKRGTYYGLLRIRIRKSSELLTRIRGWIEGLSLSA